LSQNSNIFQLQSEIALQQETALNYENNFFVSGRFLMFCLKTRAISRHQIGLFPEFFEKLKVLIAP